MSRIWKMCLMALVASGLVVAGCDKKGGDKETKEQKEEKSEAEEPKETDEDEKAEKEEKEEKEADYSQEDYVQAAAELSCIDSKLGDDQIEDREKVEKNVLGKYGFDQETYKKADSKLADKDEVKKKIDTKLEDCSKENARKYAGLEAKEDGDGKKAEKENKKPAPKPAFVGSMSGEKKDASGFDRAKLSITVRKDFSANGELSGAREGKGFRVPLKGKVSKDDKLSLSGSKGKNKVNVEGSLSEGGTTVEVSGSIWQSEFSTTMNVK